MLQVVQIAGALAILAAFALAQAGRLPVHSRPYLWLNVAGASVLAVLAYLERQWGFLLLEGVWAVVAAWGLVVGRRRARAPAHETTPLASMRRQGRQRSRGDR